MFASPAVAARPHPWSRLGQSGRKVRLQARWRSEFDRCTRLERSVTMIGGCDFKLFRQGDGSEAVEIVGQACGPRFFTGSFQSDQPFKKSATRSKSAVRFRLRTDLARHAHAICREERTTNALGGARYKARGHLSRYQIEGACHDFLTRCGARQLGCEPDWYLDDRVSNHDQFKGRSSIQSTCRIDHLSACGRNSNNFEQLVSAFLVMMSIWLARIGLAIGCRIRFVNR